MSRQEQLDILREAVDNLSKDDWSAVRIYECYTTCCYISGCLEGLVREGWGDEYLCGPYDILVAIDFTGEYKSGEWVVYSPTAIETYTNGQMQALIEKNLDQLLDEILARGYTPITQRDLKGKSADIVKRILEIEDGRL